MSDNNCSPAWGGATPPLSRTSLWPAIPALLLVFGPPVWRSFGSRSISASASGSIDWGVLLQIAVYGLALAYVTLAAIRGRENKGLPQQGLGTIVLLGLLPIMMYLSAVNSPSPMLTFVFSSLFTVGLAIAVFTGIGIATGAVSRVVLLERFFQLNLALVILVLVSRYIKPDTVAVVSQGLFRVKGNAVADLSLAASITVVYAVYLYQRGVRFQWVAVVGLLGAYALTLPAIRMGFVATAVALLLMFLGSLVIPQRGLVRRPLWLPALVLGPLVLFAGAVFFSADLVEWFTRGKVDSLKTLSGRTYIWSWISENAQVFLGNGYVAGFRKDFQSVGPLLESYFLLENLNIRRIGSAHGVFHELVYGVGWLGAVYFYGLMGWLGLKAWLRRATDSQPLVSVVSLALLALVGCFSMTVSAYVLPPGHQFGVLVFVLALLLGQLWQMSELER